MPQVHKAEVVSPLSVIIQASEEIGPCAQGTERSFVNRPFIITSDLPNNQQLLLKGPIIARLWVTGLCIHLKLL